MNIYWKIIPQSNGDGGMFGHRRGTGRSHNADGERLLVTENPQAGKIPAKGWVKITPLNMLEYTHKIEALEISAHVLYVPKK